MASIVRPVDISTSGLLIDDLQTKATEAANVSNTIATFIEESRNQLKGAAYDAFRVNLEVYKVAYEKLSKVCTALSESINSVNNGYNQYIDGCPDDACPVGGGLVNATENIPYHEQKIAELEAEIERLKQVPKDRFAGYDEKTGLPTYEPNEPEYTDAQNQIAADEAEILHRQALIRYLELLDSTVDPWAVNAMDGVEVECTKFVKDVDSINVTTL